MSIMNASHGTPDASIPDISGKNGHTSWVTLVTGAAAGIGKAITMRLLNQGHRVIAMDRDQAALDALAGHPGIIPVAFDLSDLAGTPPLLQQLIETHGPVRKLALNAGIWPGGPLIEMPIETFMANLHVNLVSPFLFLRTAAPAMRDAGGGAIVITASRNAFRSSTNNAGYDASKGGVVSLMRTAAGEFSDFNIRVNAVCPGVTATPGNADCEAADFKNAYCRQIPLNRYAEADEIAAAATFLLGDDASFITGQTLIADGGQIACQDNGRMIPAAESD